MSAQSSRAVEIGVSRGKQNSDRNPTPQTKGKRAPQVPKLLKALPSAERPAGKHNFTSFVSLFRFSSF